MSNHQMAKAPNYTNAALVMGFVNLMWVLMLLWGIYGFVPALAFGAVLLAVLRTVEDRRARRG